MGDSFQRARERIITALVPLFSFAWRLILVLTLARIRWWPGNGTGYWMPTCSRRYSSRVCALTLCFFGMALVVPVFSFPFVASNELFLGVWRAILKDLSAAPYCCLCYSWKSARRHSSNSSMGVPTSCLSSTSITQGGAGNAVGCLQTAPRQLHFPCWCRWLSCF